MFMILICQLICYSRIIVRHVRFIKEGTRDFLGRSMGEKLNSIMLIICFLTSRTERRWTVLARQVFVAYSWKLLASVAAFSDFCSWVCILHSGKVLCNTKSVRKEPGETPREDQSLKYELLCDLFCYHVTLFYVHFSVCHGTICVF